MKKKYESPTCVKVALMYRTGVMLVLSVFDEETEIVGAKGNNIFESDAADSDYINYDYLWEDNEEEDY